jgi:OmpA-OmpF porin, OOP family
MESPTAPTPEQPTARRIPKRSRNPAESFLVLIFRLLLLGVGGSFAWLLGVAIANLYPAQVQEPPLMEKTLRRSQDVIAWIKRSPQTQEKQPIQASPSPANSVPSASTTAPLPRLAPAERQQIQTELDQLQSELQALGDRTSALETRLGNVPATTPLELRLQALQQQLNPQRADSTTPYVDPRQTAARVETFSSSDTDDKTLRVTLPSDALFGDDQTTLRPEAQDILDGIVRDLQGFPRATIRVAAYTDNQDDPVEERNLTFAQAVAVEEYLVTPLADGYHWIVLGYGSQNAIVANDTPENRQRNRRVEITINPQG